MIQLHKYPKKEQWKTLAERPILEQQALDDVVIDILKNVKSNKDKALIKFAEKFDKVKLDNLKVRKSEIEFAKKQINQDLKDSIKLARKNIATFHASQKDNEKITETTKGVQCWRRSVAIDKVGLYIPGGSAPLFSTILMLGIPAKLAGCKEIILCTPPDVEGKINPVILYTANLVGINKIYKVGGAQAIAAMAYGTETIPQVYKIFGPGNQFVTKAKELIQQQGVAIDMPAGPSEVLVIADKTSNPEFIAADLLSQAEHGPDSQVILLSDDLDIINKTNQALDNQLELLPRKDIATKALKISRSILLSSIEECIEFSNIYAPEHLIFVTKSPYYYIKNITNAGSVFLGKYSCESAGDYASGTNHTLPTNGYAKNYSGVSLDSFIKKITFQNISKKGIKKIGPAIETMAQAEGLFAHKNAVTIRLKSLSDE